MPKNIFDASGLDIEGDFAKTSGGILVPVNSMSSDRVQLPPTGERRYRINADVLVIPYTATNEGANKAYIKAEDQPYVTHSELSQMGSNIQYLLDKGLITLDGFEGFNPTEYSGPEPPVKSRQYLPSEQYKYAPGHIDGPITGEGEGPKG